MRAAFPHSPRLEPDLRLSPHPLNTEGRSPYISWSVCFHFGGIHRVHPYFPISPTCPQRTLREQLARSRGTLFATYLCTPYSLRLGGLALSPHPGVDGFPVLRLLGPIRLLVKSLEFQLGSRLPTSHPPYHSSRGLPCSHCRTLTR